MATKIKGIYKGFKYFTKIFVVKEREMEIGYPTDVKHVSHIGWDGNSGNAPSWMNEFKTSSDFTTTSIGNIQELRGGVGAGSTSIISSSTWSSQDFESLEKQSEIFKDTPLMDNPKKRQKRKKSKSGSSPSTTSSARTLRVIPAKSKTKLDSIEVVERR